MIKESRELQRAIELSLRTDPRAVEGNASNFTDEQNDIREVGIARAGLMDGRVYMVDIGKIRESTKKQLGGIVASRTIFSSYYVDYTYTANKHAVLWLPVPTNEKRICSPIVAIDTDTRVDVFSDSFIETWEEVKQLSQDPAYDPALDRAKDNILLATEYLSALGIKPLQPYSGKYVDR